MSDHDPMCRYDVDGLGPYDWCDCSLIAKVRADEREEIKYEMGVLQWEGLRLRQERADLRARVEAMGHGADGGYMDAIAAVLALFDGSSDE